ncbi:MAG: ADP-ribosyltransferase domain-containing protein [Oligoflexales bacterium]
MKFFGDIVWLCYNKLSMDKRCGLSFPLNYRATADLLSASKEKVAQIDEFKKVRELYPSMTVEEANAISIYTGGDFRSFNSVLRGGDEDMLQNWFAVFATLSSGLRKLPAYQGTVYRGGSSSERVNDNYIDAFNRNEPIQEKAFTSSSYEATASFQKETGFVIQSNSGVKIDMLSRHPEEKEVLFAPGTWFKVTSVVDRDELYIDIHMEELLVVK